MLQCTLFFSFPPGTQNSILYYFWAIKVNVKKEKKKACCIVFNIFWSYKSDFSYMLLKYSKLPW